MIQRCANCGWLSVNPSGAMFCGYSDERTWEDESCMAWKDKDEPKTNADRIRAMTDEELADFLDDIIHDWGEGSAYLRARGMLVDNWDDWLKQEAQCTSE